MATKPNISNWRPHGHKAQHTLFRLTATQPQIPTYTLYIRLTATRLQSPTYQTDSRMATKPNISDWRPHGHKAQHIRLKATRPQSPTYQTDGHTATKPNISDWRPYGHKAQHIRPTAAWPQHIRLTAARPLQLTHTVAKSPRSKCRFHPSVSTLSSPEFPSCLASESMNSAIAMLGQLAFGARQRRETEPAACFSRQKLHACVKILCPPADGRGGLGTRLCGARAPCGRRGYLWLCSCKLAIVWYALFEFQF